MRALLLAVVTCSVGPAWAEPWKVVHDEGGIKVERRQAEGERFDEYRAQAHSALPVASLEAYLLGPNFDAPGEGITRQWLRRGKEEGLWYDRVHNPLVSDRDLVMHYTRRFDPGSGVLQLLLASSDEGPRPPPGIVRLRVRGSWTLTPSAAGGTDLSYAIFTDVGGSVSPWMVRGALTDETVKRVRRVLAEAGRVGPGAAQLQLPR